MPKGKSIHLSVYLCFTICFAFGQNRLSDSKAFNKIFSKTEVADAQLLFDFFNNTICREQSSNNLDSCYLTYLNHLKQAEENGQVELNINFEKQQEITSNFNSDLFSEIWEFGRVNPGLFSNDTLRMVYLSHDGKYLDFLKKVGRNYKIVNHYYETVKAARDITPSIFSTWLYPEYYDLSDIRIKFIIAIHYLSLNDRYSREELFFQSEY